MKNELRAFLEQKKFDEIAGVAARRKRTLGALVGLTYDADPLIAWRAAEAQGWAGARLASTNEDFVRSHLRRLHWLLSEESGGICRHAPQSMAEIVVRGEGKFADYAPITASLLTDMAEEDLASGFRAAVLWAIARLAPVAPGDVEPVLDRVAAAMGDTDPVVRTLAVRCLLESNRKDLIEDGPHIEEGTPPVDIYGDGDFHRTSIEELLG
jgi:hypothetical protein